MDGEEGEAGGEGREDQLPGESGQGDRETLSLLWPQHQGNKEHDMYFGEDTDTKMAHLMHSDTMIVVTALVVMIVVGLIFRNLFLRLASMKARKARMRGGLKALADHMNVVTRAMSNDLEPQNSPKAVMKTYSNYGRIQRGREGESKEGGATLGEKDSPVRNMSRENLRVQAFSNILAMEGVCRPSHDSIEMVEAQRER